MYCQCQCVLSNGYCVGMQDDELVDGVKPSWLEVGRVLAERPAAGTSASGRSAAATAAAARGGPPAPGSQLLCKWRELPYSECTWEDEADIPDAQLLIQQFRRRRPIGEMDLDAELRWLAPADDEQGPEQQQQQQQRVQDEGQPAGGSQEGGSQQQRRFQASPYFLRGELHPYQVCRHGGLSAVLSSHPCNAAADPDALLPCC